MQSGSIDVLLYHLSTKQLYNNSFKNAKIVGTVSTITLKLENVQLMTYVEKTSFFEVAPPCHSMLTNTLITYLKNNMNPILFYSGLKIYV